MFLTYFLLLLSNVEASSNDGNDAIAATCLQPSDNGFLQFVLHPYNCTLYFECPDGLLMSCPGGLVFDPVENVCNFNYNVNCTEKPQPTFPTPLTTTIIPTPLPTTTMPSPTTTPTCPPIYEEGQPNHFSAYRYAEHRDLCTLKCNEDELCCTKDSGGAGHRLPCTIGCHIAWFSQDMDECKARCNWERPIDQDCVWEWHLQEV